MRSLKPDYTLSFGLGILSFFSCLIRLQVGACVGVLRQLLSWQGIRSKSLDGTLITYLAFVSEFIPDWPVIIDPIIKTDNMTGEFTNFPAFFTPYLAIVSGYSDLLLFTMYLENGHESVIFSSRCAKWFLPKVLIKERDDEMSSFASVSLKAGFH